MDPNIMKFLEEDEDETMHSGADVDAFTAELNRDIERNSSTSQQPSDSDSAALSQGSSQTASQFLPQWQTSAPDEIVNFQSGQDLMVTDQTDQHSSRLELQHHGSGTFTPKDKDGFSQELNSLHFQSTPSEAGCPNPQDDQNNFAVSRPLSIQTSGSQPVVMQNPDHEPNPGDAQLQKLQNMSEQQSIVMGSNNQQSITMKLNDQQPLPTGIVNQQTSVGITNNQDMATMNQHTTGMGMSSPQSMISGIRNQESMTSGLQQPGTSMRNKQVPFGLLLPIIQPQLDKDRAMQLQTLYSKLKKNEITKDDFVRHMRSIVGDQMLKMAVYKLQTQSQTQATGRQLQIPTTGANSSVQMPTNLTTPTRDSNTVNSREVENQEELQGLQVSQMPSNSLSAFSQDRRHPVFPTGPNKQHMHFSQTSFPPPGSSGSSYQPFSMASSTSIRPQPRDSQIRQPTAHQNMTYVKQEPADQSNEQHKAQFSSAQGLSSLSHIKQGNATPGNLMDESFEMHSSRMGFTPPTSMSNSRVPSLTSPTGPPKALPRKPLVGQKKPMEAPGSSPPSSKKQKVSGGFLDQSIEQLNDVTAVSGVNLREEEEQLFSGSKEDSRISEISRRVVQEEEEKLILQKIPLQKKVVEIMAKSGLKSMSNDVERCLSLCVEERMRALIANLVRLSKQRVDMEKPRHRTIITSDIKQQILTINRKAREELEKKQAETEKSLSESESGAIGDGDNEKDENRLRSAKANKEEDDKMRATAANVAVRAATGVGDMLSKWQLMIEAKQKQGGTDTPSSSQPSKDVARKSLATSTRNTKESQETEKRDHPSAPFNAPASVRKVGRNQVSARRVARSITVKDVIAILEREPQMSKSTLIYRLYDKVSAEAAPAND